MNPSQQQLLGFSCCFRTSSMAGSVLLQPFQPGTERGSALFLSQLRLSPSGQCLIRDPAQGMLDAHLPLSLSHQCHFKYVLLQAASLLSQDESSPPSHSHRPTETNSTPLGLARLRDLSSPPLAQAAPSPPRLCGVPAPDLLLGPA